MVEAEAKTEVALEEYSFRVVERRSPYNFDYSRSIVIQAQLNSLCEHLNVPSIISIRALRRNELPRDSYEELNKILFLLITLEYKVRLPLALFVRRLLSELPLHPFQVSSSLWENSLAPYIMRHRVHSRDLTFEELQCYFEVKCQTIKSGTYFPYSTKGKVMRKEIHAERLISRWFFLRGPWEISIYGATPTEDHLP